MRMTVAPLGGPEDWEAARDIRLEVFVTEQGVPADLELDGADATARHWLARDPEGVPIGTARAVTRPDGSWKIGRVAVRRSWRGRGVGAAVMRAILAELTRVGAPGAYLESQTHAQAFYEKLGFVAQGGVFLEAGIPHVAMGWSPPG